MPDIADYIIPFESSSLSNPEISAQSMEQVFLRKLYDTVTKNLRNEQFSVEDLASEVAYSRSHLHRKLNELTNKSISQFIRKVRLEHGMEFLINDIGTVSEIAFKVGFGSSTYFIKCFHDEFGYSPGEAKKRHLTNLQKEDSSVTFQEEAQTETRTPLETLHPATSEHLIMEVFGALMKFKPSLAKYLADEDDEIEVIDVRLLAYQIIKSFPWPIGVELRRSFSASLSVPSEERLLQLNKTINSCLKFILFIGLAEYITAQKGQTPNQTQTKLPIRELKSDRSIIVGLKEIFKWISTCNELVIPELKDILNAQFIKEMDDWLIENEHTIGNDQTNYQLACQNSEQMLVFLLKKIAFLVVYKLVNVGSIKVNKGQFEEASFEHAFHVLNSSDAEFKIHDQVLKEFSDSRSVLLMKSIKNAHDFLNLSPWIVDTHSDEAQNIKGASFKRDIFLFNSSLNDQLEYHGTNAKILSDLSFLVDNAKLHQEFAIIHKLFEQ